VVRAVSAGGIVFRKQEGRAQVALVGRPRTGLWALPKGTPDEGEALEEAAVREVGEETGLQVRIVDKLGVIDYWFYFEGRRIHKWVHYFLMEAVGGDVTLHDWEYDEVQWFNLEQAAGIMTYDNERQIFLKAMPLIRQFLETSQEGSPIK